MNIDYNLQLHGLSNSRKIPIGKSKPMMDEVVSSGSVYSTTLDKAKLNTANQQCLVVDYNSGTTVYSLKVTDANLATLRTLSTVAGAAYQSVGLGNDGAVYWNDNLPNLTKWDSSGAKVLNAVGLERLRDTAQGIQVNAANTKFYGCPTTFYYREYNTSNGAMARTVNLSAGTYGYATYLDESAGKVYGINDGGKLDEISLATWTIARSANCSASAGNVVATANYVWVIAPTTIQIYDKATLTLVKTLNLSNVNSPRSIGDYANDILYYANTAAPSCVNAINKDGDILYQGRFGETGVLGVFSNKDLLICESTTSAVRRRKYYTKLL